MANAKEKTSRRTATKPVAKKDTAKKTVAKEVTKEEETKKKATFYRNIKDKNIVAKVVKRPNKSTVILQTGDNAVTVSVGTLEKLWEPFNPEEEQIAKVEEKKQKKEKAKQNKEATKVEWASIESLTGAVKKLVADMTFKTKHADRDILCYSGKHNVISFYVAKDRVRVLFKESDAIRNELKDFEIVKGTAQPSVILNYDKYTQTDLQHVVDTILKITTAPKTKEVKKDE